MKISLEELEGIRKMFVGKIYTPQSKFQINDEVYIKKENFKVDSNGDYSSKSNTYLAFNAEYFESYCKLKLIIIGILIRKDEILYECSENAELRGVRLISELDLFQK